MLLYLFAAVLLIVAFLFFGLAMKHRTILDREVEMELIARLDSLGPDAQAKWGRMTVAQMLRHVATALSMTTGELPIPPKRTPLAFFPIKHLVLSVLPFPRSAPTAPALVIRETDVEFAVEKSKVREQLQSLATKELTMWPVHPVFGPLTRGEWGGLVWKHVDHHLRQFGV